MVFDENNLSFLSFLECEKTIVISLCHLVFNTTLKVEIAENYEKFTFLNVE